MLARYRTWKDEKTLTVGGLVSTDGHEVGWP